LAQIPSPFLMNSALVSGLPLSAASAPLLESPPVLESPLVLESPPVLESPLVLAVLDSDALDPLPAPELDPLLPQPTARTAAIARKMKVNLSRIEFPPSIEIYMLD
jgi:hypothetical protein